MPIHDWTRVSAGIFHSFHLSWTDAIMAALNGGLLPSDYYALAEQVASKFEPDGLGLRFNADADPALIFQNFETSAEAEMDGYARQQSSVGIHHSSGDQVVARIEIVSPGIKGSRYDLRSFVEKAATALNRGYHLLVLDLHPPTRRDPHGIHGAIWEEIADGSFHAPTDKPLTLVAYEAGTPKAANYEPVAVGDVLPDMPLFLRPGIYIKVPLEATYRTAWGKVPQRWRRVLEETTE